MIYFLIYLFLEVLISVNISSAIGGLMTFIEIIVSALVGISILVNFRQTLFANLNAVSMGQIDLQRFQQLNLFTLFGAVLLIIPGFLTDIMGILMQFSVITSMFVNRYYVKSNHDNKDFNHTYTQKDSDVIDVEIIDDKSITK